MAAVRCCIIYLVFLASWVGHPQGWVVLGILLAAAAIRKKTEEEQFLISPLTGERISADKAAEHMKVKCVCV